MRRVQVWHGMDWDNPMWKEECARSYTGWLVSLSATGDYPDALVVDAHGRVRTHDMRLVQLLGLSEIPLLHGAAPTGQKEANGAPPTGACS